jgi:hypothetical protein
MKQRLTKSEIEELKRTMRTWAPTTLQSIAKLYGHIAYLEERVEKQQEELRELRELTKVQQVAAEKKVWATPSCSVKPLDELPIEQRGTKLNRLLRLKAENLIGSEAWQLNLRYSKLTHEQAMEMISENE